MHRMFSMQSCVASQRHYLPSSPVSQPASLVLCIYERRLEKGHVPNKNPSRTDYINRLRDGRCILIQVGEVGMPLTTPLASFRTITHDDDICYIEQL